MKLSTLFDSQYSFRDVQDMADKFNKYGLAAKHIGGKFYSYKNGKETGGPFDTMDQLAKHQEELLANELKKVIVVDAYLEWCGPCQCMESNYAGLYFSVDSPDTRICFWQCQEEFLGEELKEKLKLDVVPRFLVYQGGELKKEIVGAKLVDLTDAINEFIPEMDD